MSEYLFLIPLFPLIGFLINGLLIGRLPKPLISLIACGSIGLSFLLSCSLFFELKDLAPDARQITQTLFTWISVGQFPDQFQVSIGYLLDPLSAIMILVVMTIFLTLRKTSIAFLKKMHWTNTENCKNPHALPSTRLATPSTI